MLPYAFGTAVGARTTVSAAHQPRYLHIVATASTQHTAITLEDLTSIRERTNQEPRPKTERRRSNSWAFLQLRQFVQYKAALAGVVLLLVPAAYTSQMCHACLHLGARKGKRFTCANPACGWTGDADHNGATNIKIWGHNGSVARGPWVHCHLQGSRKLMPLRLG